MQELERERAAAAREQACVRDSALEAIGADLTAGAAAARLALEASTKLAAALADIADAKVVMHAALLELQSKQAAAVEAACVGKARSGAVLISLSASCQAFVESLHAPICRQRDFIIACLCETAMLCGRSVSCMSAACCATDDKPGNGGSPAASECLATQAVSHLLSPARSAGGASVRKAVVVETSREVKAEHSQRGGATTQVSAGGGGGAERGAVTSPPPRHEAAINQDETQVHSADDMVLDEEPVQEPAEQQEEAAEKPHEDGVERGSEPAGDGVPQDGDEGDHQQEQGPDSQQGDGSQRQEGADGVPAQDEVVANDHAAKEPAADQSHPADAAMQEEDAVAPPQADSSPPLNSAAEDMGRSSPGDEVRDSESNGDYFAADGQAQADTLVAPSIANVSVGNSLDGIL